MRMQPTAEEVRRDLFASEQYLLALRDRFELEVIRPVLERLAASCIDALDTLDAVAEDREPDGEDEIVSEDDGLVRRWSAHVGRQA